MPAPVELFRPARSGRRRLPPRRPVASWLALASLATLGRLPLSAVYRLGGRLGALAARLPLRAARDTRINLQLCFPDMSAAERERFVRVSLSESARTMMEAALFAARTRTEVLGLVRDVQGEEHMSAALARGRGVVMAVPHLGAWELLAYYCSSRFALTTLYRAPVVPSVARRYTRRLERSGVRVEPDTTQGVRAIRRALDRGEVVVVMPDMDPHLGAGVFVPFFGILANTTTLPLRLVQRTGARLVCASAVRLPAAAGFRVQFRPASPAIDCGELFTATAALNRDLEALIREVPEQYLWSYRRFRIRPPGQPNPYRPQLPARFP